MSDPNHSKTGLRPGGGGPEKPAPAPSGPASRDKAAPGSGGRVVHDSRGNAVWQWLKDTGRHAIESTSALLKKLEVPELKVEDHKEDNEPRLEDEVDAGGGYDPYGTRAGSKKPPPPRTPLKKR
ncbi:MAG TPA: hypothetical protein VGR86_03400 [Steroidobacteraceae bacterium]|nr:hypothetical protein [Steroidobacteraceae bacterium]